MHLSIARLAVLSVLLLPVTALADALMLSCIYPLKVGDAVSSESQRLTPRALTIDTERSLASWNDITVKADVSDTTIRFAFSGFEYAINRLNGEIVFSNPTKLAEWQRYRSDMTRAAQTSGRSENVRKATEDVASAQSHDFGGVQHQGKCDVSKDRKF